MRCLDEDLRVDRVVHLDRPRVQTLVLDMAAPAFSDRGVKRSGLFGECSRVGNVAGDAVLGLDALVRGVAVLAL